MASDPQTPSNSTGLAYLFSRYPVPSQTFCDWEMLAHEAVGFPLLIASLNPPPSLFRHDHFSRIASEIVYPPASGVPGAVEVPEAIVRFAEGFEKRYGNRYRPAQRARNAAHFGRLLRKRGVRHCHVHFANQATVTALMMRPLGITYSFTAHGQDFTTDLGDEGLLQELAEGAEFVVGVSDSARELLCTLCPKSAGKIHRVYNGIDLDRFPAARPELGGRLEIISIGRLIEFKGFLDLVEACALLRERGIDFRCTLVGDGPQREEIQDRISALALDEQIVLAGLLPLDEIRSHLSSSHLFALASKFDSNGAADTLPTVITEAMACRLPVVSTRLAGIPEMVDPGETGLLFEPGDVPALAEALAELAATPDRRRRMGLAGRKKAERLFALEHCAGQLRELLRPVVSTTAAPPSPQILYLVRGTDGLEEELEVARESEHVEVLDLGECLPDASVLEGEWLADSTGRERIESIRKSLPRASQGTAFYQTAREAVALRRIVQARGFRVIHAARSDTALLAFLLAALTERKPTATVEPEPVATRSLLRALVPQLALASIADPRIAKEFPKSEELLGLAPPERRQFRLGPIRITHGEKPQPRDPSRTSAFFKRLQEVASHD